MSAITLNPLQSRIRAVALILWLTLVLLVFARQVVTGVSPTALGTGLLFSLPLLAPLRGLLRGDRYTYSWATMCVLPYFIVGIMEAVANPATHGWALVLLGASLLWFFSLIAYLRVTST